MFTTRFAKDLAHTAHKLTAANKRVLIWSAHNPQATIRLTYGRKACVNMVSTQPTSDCKTLLREEGMC